LPFDRQHVDRIAFACVDEGCNMSPAHRYPTRPTVCSCKKYRQVCCYRIVDSERDRHNNLGWYMCLGVN
jgi:hypothetical protein